MSSNESDNFLLDRFLDDVMSAEESERFLQKVDAAELNDAKEIQSKIDDSLKRMLSGLSIDEAQVESQFLAAEDGGSESSTPSKPIVPNATSTKPNSALLKWAVAAMLLIVVGLGVWFNSKPGNVEPFFVERPLTDVYQEKVQDYRPYYVCDDNERFAMTFENKLGVSLVLAEMPADRTMLGLSYLGGISRDSVAMLSNASDEKVIVFVAREDAPGIDTAIKSTDPNLNLFIERKFGLVFVEVSPLQSPTMLEYFKLAQ